MFLSLAISESFDSSIALMNLMNSRGREMTMTWDSDGNISALLYARLNCRTQENRWEISTHVPGHIQY